MACRLGLLVLDGLDRFGERGAAADVASLMVTIIVGGGVAQHIVKRIRPDQGALPVSTGDRVGVHRYFLSSCGAKASQLVTSESCRVGQDLVLNARGECIGLLRLLAQKE